MGENFVNKTLLFKTLFIGALLIHAGCKKDDAASTPPSIDVMLPVENTVHNVFDTVEVKFSVQDNDRLASVTVTLVDLNNQPVQATVDVTPSSASATITMEYVLYDIHLASGYYYIKVHASDGSAGNSVLRKIYVNEAPKMLKNAYIVSQPSPTSRSVYKLDSLQNLVLAGSYSGDVSQAAISSWYQDLYLGGAYNGDAVAIGLEDNSTLWTINCIPSSNPYFTDLHVSGKNVYVSYYDGRLKGYGVTGSIVYNAVVQSGFYPVRLAMHNQYLAVSTKEIISPARKLVLFNGSTGSGVQETVLSQDIVEMFTKDNDNLFCFGNDAGQGKIQIYQVSTNGFWTPYNCPAGSILSVAQVDANTYLIGMSDGIIYKYQYNISSMVPLINGVTASCLRFDDVNLHVYVAEGTTVKRFLYSNGSLINSVPHSGTIIDLELLFNK